METIKVFLLSWLFFMIFILHRKPFYLTSKNSETTKFTYYVFYIEKLGKL